MRQRPGRRTEDSRTEWEGFDQLVRQAQGGDKQAMDRILEIHRPYLENLARICSDPAIPPEDLLQEARLQAWRKIGSFRGGRDDEETFWTFRAWICQIVKHLGLNARRNGGRQMRSPPGRIVPLEGSATTADTDGKANAVARDPSPSACAREAERARKVQEELENLPDRTNADIFRMRFRGGLSLRKIAERLGLEYDEVKNRYRATTRLLEGKLGHLI